MDGQLLEQQRIAFCGGGTGGHVYPALAVIESLPDSRRDNLLWIGSRDGMEREIIIDAGIPYFGIPSGKLRRYFSVKNFSDPFRVLAGFFAARRILREQRAAVLFSKGGFVAVPVVWAARSLSIPVVIHESDVSPGLATRITARSADVIFVPYPESNRYFPARDRERLVVAGNPIRAGLVQGDAGTALSRFGMEDRGETVILILGGSLGALQVNELVWSGLDELTGEAIVVHQTGAGNLPSEEICAVANENRYIVREYFSEELPDLYARADIVIARAGAGLVWEIAANRIPAVLIPLSGHVSRGDQLLNAEFLESSGAALVLDPEEVDVRKFINDVLSLLHDRGRREEMTALGGERFHRNAAQVIADRLVRMTEGG